MDGQRHGQRENREVSLKQAAMGPTEPPRADRLAKAACLCLCRQGGTTMMKKKKKKKMMMMMSYLANPPARASVRTSWPAGSLPAALPCWALNRARARNGRAHGVTRSWTGCARPSPGGFTTAVLTYLLLDMLGTC